MVATNGNGNQGGEVWDVIHTYSQAQAIEDGVLVDLRGLPVVRELGFAVPIVMTSTAYTMTVQRRPMPDGYDEARRLRVLLESLHAAIVTANRGTTDRVHFKAHVTLASGPMGCEIESVPVWALIGPSDDGSACITVMLEGED